VRFIPGDLKGWKPDEEKNFKTGKVEYGDP